MDIYTDDSKFDEFILFINNNKNKLDREDLIQYYNGALNSSNYKLVDFLLTEFEYVLNKRYIEKTLSLLTEPKYTQMINVFKTRNINTRQLLENVVMNFINKLKYKYDDKMINQYIRFIVNIIQDIERPDINIIKMAIGKDNINNNNLEVLLGLVDIFILFGCNTKVNNIDNDQTLLLFSNLNKKDNIEDIINNIDTYILDIIKDELDIKDKNILIKYFKDKNKVTYITKITEDFYVYHDMSKNWCFDNDNIDYIKKHRKNPYNGIVISDDIIDQI